MKILVTGVTGQLGYEIKNMIQGHEVIGVSRNDMDVTNANNTNRIIKEIKPDVVIHCAAYTKVDDAEKDPDSCYKVNVIGSQNLASATYSVGSKILFVSTDYLFDGKKNTPYIEFDTPNPLNVYGKSKLVGESFIKELNPRHFIVRTAWLYGENGNNFIKTMLRLSKDREILRVVNDQRGTPTSTVDLARGILKLIYTDNYGTYHGTCKGETTWNDFAKKIFQLSNIKINVEPISTEEFGSPALRPKYSVLRNYMYELTMGDPFREWEESLSEYIKKVKL